MVIRKEKPVTYESCLRAKVSFTKNKDLSQAHKLTWQLSLFHGKPESFILVGKHHWNSYTIEMQDSAHDWIVWSSKHSESQYTECIYIRIQIYIFG